jgi:hypothetical protein
LLLSYSLNAQTSTNNCHRLAVILSCEWEKVGAKHYIRLIKKKKEYRQSDKEKYVDTVQRSRFGKERNDNYEE